MLNKKLTRLVILSSSIFLIVGLFACGSNSKKYAGVYTDNIAWYERYQKWDNERLEHLAPGSDSSYVLILDDNGYYVSGELGSFIKCYREYLKVKDQDRNLAHWDYVAYQWASKLPTIEKVDKTGTWRYDDDDIILKDINGVEHLIVLGRWHRLDEESAILTSREKN